MGVGENPGLAPRIFIDIFRKVEILKNYLFTISLNFIEVYNEVINDLLSDKQIDVTNELDKGTTLTGMKETFIYKLEDAFEYLTKGNSKRKVENLNGRVNSSRSHVIIQIIIESKLRKSNSNMTNIKRIVLVDLANTEKLLPSINVSKSQTHTDGSINKSLLSLKKCFQALVEVNEKHSSTAFIPWRESKLTRILKVNNES